MKQVQEQLLLVRIRNFGDQQAFAELYEMFADSIYRFIYFKVSDAEAAKDLTAEVFLRCWKQLSDSSKEIEYLKPFLYTTARNIVIDYYRKEGRATQVGLDQAKTIEAEDQSSKIIAKADVQEVLRVMKKLKQSYQEILLLKHIEDLSLKEISKVIEKTPVSTRVLLHRANQALKREYEKITTNN